MSGRSANYLPVAVALILSMTACGDNPTAPSKVDTTPPVVTAITPRDIYHVDVKFDEEITDASQGTGHYLLVKSSAPFPDTHRLDTAPGDSMSVMAAVLKADRRTITITSYDTMSGLHLILVVKNVSDAHGNEITTPVERTFTGSNLADHVPPEVIRSSPSSGAVGVAVGTPVVIQFSEPIDYHTLKYGIQWSSGWAFVPISMRIDGATVTLAPQQLLPYNTEQRISLNQLTDIAGNRLVDTNWSFTTTNTVDHTPPEIVSMSPVDLAINVDVDSRVSVTFSEPVNRYYFHVDIEPALGDGSVAWSNGGRTCTLEPGHALQANRQYRLLLYPENAVDLAGNRLAQTRSVIFSTGPALESGVIAGVVTGEPGSGAADPSGAVVSAGAYRHGAPGYFTAVADDDSYEIPHLPDGAYSIYAMLDSNHDGLLNWYSGDAVGYSDSVGIAGGSHETGINLQLYDPSVAWGTVAYDGVHTGAEWWFEVGLFKTGHFDAADPGVPVVSVGGWWPQDGWSINSLDWYFAEGVYYLFAYLDVNHNGSYEPGVDPAGVYGGDSPILVRMKNGNDFPNIVIPIVDPQVASSSASVVWPAARPNAEFQHLRNRIRESQLHTTQ